MRVRRALLRDSGSTFVAGVSIWLIFGKGTSGDLHGTPNEVLWCLLRLQGLFSRFSCSSLTLHFKLPTTLRFPTRYVFFSFSVARSAAHSSRFAGCLRHLEVIPMQGNLQIFSIQLPEPVRSVSVHLPNFVWPDPSGSPGWLLIPHHYAVSNFQWR